MRVLRQVCAELLDCQWVVGVDVGGEADVDVDLNLVFRLSAEPSWCLSGPQRVSDSDPASKGMATTHDDGETPFAPGRMEVTRPNVV